MRAAKFVSGTLIAVCTPWVSLAQAGYIQSLGVSEACIAMGGACVATSDDLGAYYSNPAGAAQFARSQIGGNFRLLDTRGLDLEDSDGDHDIPGSNTRSNQVLAPSVAGYRPLGKGFVAGLALGAPFAITADWTNDDGVHRYNMADQSLFLLDVSPNLAWKVTERFSLGLALNITALKQLRTQTLIPNTFLIGLPTALGGLGSIVDPTPTSPTVGSVTLQTDGDVRLGIPPDRFAAAFDEGTFTLGLQYRFNDAWRVGANYRNITRTKWRGSAQLDLPLIFGSSPQQTRFTTALDMPGHLQIGTAFSPNSRWLWTLDVQRTFWSQTRGFGSPVDIRFDQPLLGLINNLRIDYDAQDAMTYRTGLRYAVTPTVSVMGGYAYDEQIFPDRSVDVLTYDSNRHIFSLGSQIDLRAANGSGWTLAGSAQLVRYQSRTIQSGTSRNLGGLSQPNLDLATGTLGFVPNTEAFRYGGDIVGIGISATYAF